MINYPEIEFKVEPRWDNRAKVWYAESDIEGLNVEVEKFEDFWDAVRKTIQGLYLSVSVSIPKHLIVNGD